MKNLRFNYLSKFNWILLILPLLVASCSAHGDFFYMPEGSTIPQVNSESWVYCAVGSKTDRKYIRFDKNHPYIDGLLIYKHTIYDEKLTPKDYDDFRSRRCEEPIFFMHGKLISKNKVLELESAIPQDQRANIISSRKIKEEAELNEKLTKERKEKEEFEKLSWKELNAKRDDLFNQYKKKQSNDVHINNTVDMSDPVNKQIALEIEKIEKRKKEVYESDIARSSKERDEKLKKDKVEYEKRLLAEDRQRQIEMNKCLSSGDVGICVALNLNPHRTINNCGLRGYPGCMLSVEVEGVVDANLSVKNNLKTSIKDITLSCAQVARSGTILVRNLHTVYDHWNPGEIKSVGIRFPKHNQVSAMTCSVSSFK